MTTFVYDGWCESAKAAGASRLRGVERVRGAELAPFPFSGARAVGWWPGLAAGGSASTHARPQPAGPFERVGSMVVLILICVCLIVIGAVLSTALGPSSTPVGWVVLALAVIALLLAVGGTHLHIG